jgi:carbamoylphosphate synthase small subunit
MTGYIETLTDPSYAGQLLTFTSPILGNYGVPDQTSWESDRIHATGVIISELATNWSHASSVHSLLEWFTSQEIPFITDVDTRAITKLIRSRGPMAAMISRNEHRTPTVQTAIAQNAISLMVNVPSTIADDQDAFDIRRLAIDHHVPLITNAEVAVLVLRCLTEVDYQHVPIKSWQEFASPAQDRNNSK